uniref:Uncharacterized protein n=1 Tax=Cynoglossus semilaevis TaxID=244447 RepID=A0A3P8VT24_CYNSE
FLRLPQYSTVQINGLPSTCNRPSSFPFNRPTASFIYLFFKFQQIVVC